MSRVADEVAALCKTQTDPMKRLTEFIDFTINRWRDVEVEAPDEGERIEVYDEDEYGLTITIIADKDGSFRYWRPAADDTMPGVKSE